jgi:NAD(P)-dependent dehydrogenase (short-subunit alcohol dehydrogenase family)
MALTDSRGNNMVSIEGKVAVVTGAGRGIGQAVAIELGRLGARVAVASRSRSELDGTAKKIGNASVFPTDVRKKDEVNRLFEQVHATLGPVDILVNAAGVGIMKKLVDLSDEDFETLIQTNLRSMFYTCRYALPSMIERKTGHIVNIASIAGKVGSATRTVYCASKFGVVGFTESLAEEVRSHGVRVAVICPGSTNTAFHSGATPDQASRMLSPFDVANAVRTIVTQEPNSFISEIVMRPTQKP